MKRIRWVPGAVVAGVNITIPTVAPDIEAVIEARITRIPSAFVLAHAPSAVPVIHADGAAPVVHKNMAVDPHIFTQPNLHTLTPDVAKGGVVTKALGHTGLGALETAKAAPAVGLPTCIDVHAGGAVDAHTVVQPDNHAQADVVAALANHGQAAIVAALIDHAASGVTVAVVAVPTRVTSRIITLDVNTALGDLLTLAYYEVGERVLVS